MCLRKSKLAMVCFFFRCCGLFAYFVVVDVLNDVLFIFGRESLCTLAGEGALNVRCSKNVCDLEYCACGVSLCYVYTIKKS